MSFTPRSKRAEQEMEETEGVEIPEEPCEPAPSVSEADRTKEENWQYLRNEIDTRLLSLQYIMQRNRRLTIADRTRAIQYEDALVRLEEHKDAPWTPSTIPWPVNPLEEK